MSGAPGNRSLTFAARKRGAERRAKRGLEAGRLAHD